MRLPRWLRWRTDRELDEELQAHLDLETQGNIERGLPSEEAYFAARRSLGNLTRLRERAREADPLGWLQSVHQDLRYGFRNLARNPGFTAVAVLSLALGIGANTAIFTVINVAMLKPLPVSHPEELVMLTWIGAASKDSASFPDALWEKIRDHQDVLRNLFSYGSTHLDLSGVYTRMVPAGFVSGEFFSTLGVRPVLGRILTDADDRPGCPAVAVITHAFWQNEYAGAGDVIGKSITLDRHPFLIVGVAKPPFFGVEYGYHVPVWVPSCAEAILFRPADGSMGRMVIGRPKPNVTMQQVRAHFASLAPAILKDKQDRKATLGVIPFSNGIPALRVDYGSVLAVLMAVSGVVLLIACANIANLLLARATARQREIAVRLALGASRRRLVRQLLTESLLLSLVGATLGVLFASRGSRILVGLLSRPGQVVLDLSPDLTVLAFTIAAGLCTGVLFGLAPAWRAVRVDLHTAMKAGGRGSRVGFSRFSAGRVLMVAQVSLSVVLIMSAGLLLGSWRRLATLDPGFRSDGVLVARVNTLPARIPADQLGNTYRRILERLRAIPGTASASASSRTPIDRTNWPASIDVAGFTPTPGDNAVVQLNEVSDGYFATMGIRILAGRDFGVSEVPAAPAALVSEELARKFFGGIRAIGKHFRIQSGRIGPVVEIIGIAANTKQFDVREASRPIVYLALSQKAIPSWEYNFALRAGTSPPALIPGAKAAIADIAPGVSLDLTTLDQHVGESLRLPRTLGVLSGFFGALALLLASIGLHGIMSYTVARRRGEIGIRIALGAAGTRVIGMVLGDAARIAIAGVAIGALLSLAVTRLVAKLLFGVEPNDPATLAISVLTLVAVSIFAAMMPAWRAARLDPVATLRED